MTRHQTCCPAQRLSQPTRQNADGRRVIDIGNYAPYFLTAINSALSRAASSHYLQDFGIGITEWRVLSWIATEPDIQASRICDVIVLDKGAVSRSVGKLDAMGYLTATQSESDPRRKSLRLSAAGENLHDRILEQALAREAALIEGVDPDDLETFLHVMRIMRQNVDRM